MRKVLSICISLLASSTQAALFMDNAKQDDLDHPLIRRFPGSQVFLKKTTGYIDATLVFRCAERGQKAQAFQIQGKQTQIVYQGPANKSQDEVFVNYAAAIKKAGFEVVFETPSGKRLDFMCKNHLIGSAMSPLSPGGRAIIAKKQGTYVQIISSEDPRRGTLIYLNVLEERSIQTDQVGVNAEYLAQELDQSGHVAVYGILFDLDSDRITPESTPTLEQIALLLRNRPQLRLYVVGHSDMQGELSHNLDLSRRRALAVAQALVTRHRITPARLQAHGVGPLSPKASNRVEDGRKQNRRVELIEIGI